MRHGGHAHQYFGARPHTHSLSSNPFANETLGAQYNQSNNGTVNLGTPMDTGAGNHNHNPHITISNNTRRMMHGGPHQMNTMDGGINNGNGNGHDRRRQSRDNMGRRK